MPGMATEHVFVLGMGGTIMSAIASLLHDQGYRVSGSDLAASRYTRALDPAITLYEGHRAENLPADIAWVTLSDAVPKDNPELLEARRRGLPIRSRAEVIAEFTAPYKTICVAGTHGKTSTCGLISVGLIESGLDAGYLIGADSMNYGPNYRRAGGDWMVIEADEFARALVHLRPTVGIVTALEMDHPDVYRDWEDYQSVFRTFVGRIDPDGLLLLGADCPAARSLAPYARCRVQTYGYAADADWRLGCRCAINNGMTATVYGPGGLEVELVIGVPGDHMLQNAAAALAACIETGQDPAAVGRALRAYQGMGRRFERLIDQGGILVVDDYAHHPAEVRTTVAGAARLGRRLRVVCQPHQICRTKLLLDDYAGAFAAADEAYLVDIQRSREDDDPSFTAAQVAAAAGDVEYLGDLDAAFERLTSTAGEDEVWLCLGAGTSSKLAQRLAAWVQAER